MKYSVGLGWVRRDMETARLLPTKSRRPLIKGIFLLAFIVASIAAVRFTPVKGYLTPEGLGRFLESAGDWGGLLSGKVFFSVALFVFSFFIPKIIKKIKGE